MIQTHTHVTTTPHVAPAIATLTVLPSTHKLQVRLYFTFSLTAEMSGTFVTTSVSSCL